MSRLDVSLACDETDRTAAVLEGRLEPIGIDLAPVRVDAATATRRTLDDGDFDAAEVSLVAALAAADVDEPPVVCLPVFPGRSFVHSRVHVGEDAGAAELADLAGARVGVSAPWSATALWLRGILADRHGVEDVEWRLVGDDGPAVDGAEVVPADRSLGAMLEAGELDAAVAAEPPAGSRRLHDDPRAAERAYVREASHFPITTVLVLDRATYDRHAWVAQELYKAFDAAKDRCLEAIGDPVGRAAVPWLQQSVEEARALMGEDYWPYGVDANRATVETAARYAAEQGVTDAPLDVEALFAPETFEAFKV